MMLDIGVGRSRYGFPGVIAGRGGSCELMIGCVAQAAAGQQLRVDPDEMEDVRCDGALSVGQGLRV
jgi:hypothetical protein